MQSLNLSIAISSDSSERGLARCLSSIRAQEFFGQVDVKVYHWSDFPDRALAISEAKQDGVLLLDGDCSLPTKNFLSFLAQKLNASPEVAAFGGGYRDLTTNSYWDRAYNQLCNSWVERGLIHSDSPSNLLGGCLFIVKSRLPQKFKFPKVSGWGGDTLLIRHLKKSVRLEYSPDLSVLHQPDNGLVKTVRRGFQHGFNRSKYHLMTPGKRAKFLPPIQHLPWWALHFSAVELGSAWHQLRKPR